MPALPSNRYVDSKNTQPRNLRSAKKCARLSSIELASGLTNSLTNMLPQSLEEQYRTINTVYIHKQALKHNLKLFRTLLPHHSICPVLKSNAYGHDLVGVAEALTPENPDYFIVDSLYEAYSLRVAKIQTPILVGATLPMFP